MLGFSTGENVNQDHSGRGAASNSGERVAQPAPEREEREEAARTALLVDDDPRVQRIVSAYLKHLGFEVIQVTDGRKAIDVLESSRPTLLCTDLVLPEASGYDICRYVRASDRLRGLPILVISARALPADQALAEELGVREYLVKPFSKADFISGVKRTLQG